MRGLENGFRRLKLLVPSTEKGTRPEKLKYRRAELTYGMDWGWASSDRWKGRALAFGLGSGVS